MRLCRFPVATDAQAGTPVQQGRVLTVARVIASGSILPGLEARQMPATEKNRTPDRSATVARRQAAYLNRLFPAHRIASLRWSGGTTQVIEAGQGSPVLLIHGGLGEGFQWAPLFPLLAPSHRLLAVDRPGHGLADAFDYRGVDVLEHARQFIGETLSGLRLTSLPIVGTSMGGLWAVAFALARPECVSRLILVGSPAGAVRSVPLMLRLATLPGFRSLAERGMARPTPESVRNFWKLLVAHPERLSQDFLELSAASQSRNYRNWLTLIDAVMSLRGFRRELLLAPHWASLKMPTTLVWGERDAWAPLRIGASLAAAHARIDLIPVPDAGHAPWFDDPASVARAILEALSR